MLFYLKREEIPQEVIGEALASAAAEGLKPSEAEALVQKVYMAVPSTGEYEKMQEARRRAEKCLPSLADEVQDSIPLIMTASGYPLRLAAGPPILESHAVRVPIYFVKDLPAEEGMHRASYLHTGKDIYVEEANGAVRVKVPPKAELMKSALESALDRFALPFSS